MGMRPAAGTMSNTRIRRTAASSNPKRTRPAPEPKRLRAVRRQAIVFGLMHSYQGWKRVIVISALGVLSGTLAAWRGNLGANMIAHAWSDVWEGWLKMVV